MTVPLAVGQRGQLSSAGLLVLLLLMLMAQQLLPLWMAVLLRLRPPSPPSWSLRAPSCLRGLQMRSAAEQVLMHPDCGLVTSERVSTKLLLQNLLVCNYG